MKVFKNYLCVLLAACLLALMSATAFAQEGNDDEEDDE